MLTLCCHWCENVTLLRHDSNLSLNATWWKLDVITVLHHIQCLFMDRDGINMQLSDTLAFEWIWPWLPVICVRVFACVYVCGMYWHSPFIYWLQCQGFLVPVSVEPVQTSVTQVSFPGWPFRTLPSWENVRCVCMAFQCCLGGPDWLRIWLIQNNKTPSEY